MVIDPGRRRSPREDAEGIRPKHFMRSRGVSTRDTAHGLESLDHRVEAPRLDLGVECLVETLEAFGVVGDRSEICLEDQLMSRGGTDDR